MSAITDMIVPDIISTSQTWAVEDVSKYGKLLTRILNKLYPGNVWQNTPTATITSGLDLAYTDYRYG